MPPDYDKKMNALFIFLGQICLILGIKLGLFRIYIIIPFIRSEYIEPYTTSV